MHTARRDQRHPRTEMAHQALAFEALPDTCPHLGARFFRLRPVVHMLSFAVRCGGAVCRGRPATRRRRFTATTGVTPLRRLHTRRIHRARELLETTDDSVELVAARTGMGTAATLRRHFHRALGVPPDTYRRTFRNPVP